MKTFVLTLALLLLVPSCAQEDATPPPTCAELQDQVQELARRCDMADASGWYPKCDADYQVEDTRACADLLEAASCAEVNAGPGGTACALRRVP